MLRRGERKATLAASARRIHFGLPGRDSRPAFRTAAFAEGVEKLADLVPGMLLEGVVTNVAAFGAFVDVGVHQDGLVYISAMSRTFVKDPREIVKLALAKNAAAVVLAHPHPSGVAEPSQADELITQRVKEALALVDIRVVDHMIVAAGEVVSLAERGAL